jgi:hypothetical protein
VSSFPLSSTAAAIPHPKPPPITAPLLAPSSVPYFFSIDIEAQPDTIASAAIDIKHAASFLSISTFLLRQTLA